MIDTSGEARGVRVALRGLAVRRSHDGRRVYPYPDFGADLIDYLYRHIRVVRRSFWSAPRCGSCGERVPDGASAPIGRAIRVDLGRIPAFDYDVVAPGRRCGRCGETSFSGGRDFEAAMSDAVIDALTRAGVRPT